MAALGLIAQHPGSTGYDLLKRFELSLAHVWPATQSQLYGELGRLAAAGLIEVSAVGPRSRKEYRASAAGQAAIRDWLAEESLEPLRNPLLLRVFLLAATEQEPALEYLAWARQQTMAVAERLDQLVRSIDWTESREHLLAQSVLDWGAQVCRLQDTWLTRTAGSLRAASDPDPGTNSQA